MSLATTNIRKAALLVRSLDADSAALLLAQLSSQEARAVRQAVRELGEIDPEEQAQLARELRRQEAAAPSGEHGVELQLETGSETYEAPSRIAAPPRQTTLPTPNVTDESPFAWLEHGDLPTLANVLEREHLSTVAVVLSHLPAQRAAELLAALPSGRRAAALQRLADLGESDRASLEVIEKSLADWIARQKRQRQLRADRLNAIRAMLKHSPREARQQVLAELARGDSPLTGELDFPLEPISPHRVESPLPARWAGQVSHLRVPRSRIEGQRAVAEVADKATTPPPAPVAVKHPPLPPFEFWKLGRLNRHELALLMGSCDMQTLVLALAGGSDQVMRHVTRQLPSEVARELTRRVNHLPQVQLSEVATAQHQVAQTAAKLIASGKLPHREVR